MQHIYLLKGLNCAHCAGKIENKTRKMEGVESAELNFAVSKLMVESQLDCDELFSKIKKIVNDLEPGVKVSAICPHIRKARHAEHEHHDHEHEHEHEHHHHEHEHEHEHHHGESCSCGHEHHEHDHECDCGHEHHDHDHHEGCSCGNDHHEHDHECDCGHDHHEHEHHEGCSCAHDHHEHEHECDCGHDHHEHEHEHHAHEHKHEHHGHGHSHSHDEDEHGHGHDHGHSHSHGHGEGMGKKLLIRLVSGLALCAIAVFAPVPELVSALLFVGAYLIFGADIIISAVSGIFKGRIFDENFLMTVASIGALFLGEYVEACAVMGLYQIGEYFQDKAVARSRKSIADLTNIRADHANVERGGAVIKVEPEDVDVGEIIVINPFERVPLDGECIFGESFIDTAALTGESVPRRVEVGSTVLSGCVNQSGTIKVRVTKLCDESMASRVQELIEGASAKKAPTERFITRFSRYYTPAVTAAAVLLAIIPSLITGEWSVWIERALTFLVVSCPCAIVISVPLTYFGGIGKASSSGILIKGAGYLDTLTSISDIVFDKTGTLTKGEFAVKNVETANGFEKNEVLKLAAGAESSSSHPIAKSIMAACGAYDRAEDVSERPGYGVSASVCGKTVLVGSARLLEDAGVSFDYIKGYGSDVLVSVDGVFAGVIRISDTVKDGADKALKQVKALGIVDLHMLTGDNAQAAKGAAQKLGIGNVLSDLLPQHKLSALESIMGKASGKCAYVGDGINDAPVLARADIGIAMGALGSDAALEAADVVLMDDELGKISLAVKIARKTAAIVKQNISFALIVKAIILVLSAMGKTPMWLAVFADVGVALLCVLNSLRAIK